MGYLCYCCTPLWKIGGSPIYYGAIMTADFNIAVKRLLDAGIGNARNEARWLAENVGEQEFASRLERRLKGEPLQYILGTVPFHDIQLYVGPGVLIPRPETEQLVELALSLHIPDGPICDLCTGSGAIALAMAFQLRHVAFTGIDISEEALRWARRNQNAMGLDNVTFLEGDLYAPRQENARFAMLTANPPYVTSGEYSQLESVVKDYEPRLALEAGDEGLDIITRIIHDAPGHLMPGGRLVMEIGEKQGNAVEQLLSKAGFAAEIKTDYAGRQRFAVAVFNPQH